MSSQPRIHDVFTAEHVIQINPLGVTTVLKSRATGKDRYDELTG